MHFSFPIILKFCTKHSSDTTVLCANIQNNWAAETLIMSKLNLSLGWISKGYLYIVQQPQEFHYILHFYAWFDEKKMGSFSDQVEVNLLMVSCIVNRNYIFKSVILKERFCVFILI